MLAAQGPAVAVARFLREARLVASLLRTDGTNVERSLIPIPIVGTTVSILPTTVSILPTTVSILQTAVPLHQTAVSMLQTTVPLLAIAVPRGRIVVAMAGSGGRPTSTGAPDQGDAVRAPRDHHAAAAYAAPQRSGTMTVVRQSGCPLAASSHAYRSCCNDRAT